MRLLVLLFLLLVGQPVSAAFFSPCCSNNSQTTSAWSDLKIGAGGYITGLWVDPGGSGIYYNRTDSYGGYFWDKNAASPGNAGGLGAWKQLITPTSVTGVALGTTGGLYEVTGAQSNPAHAYMIWLGDLYSSTNSGVNWTKASGWTNVPFTHANDGSGIRLWGRFGAVDPIDENTTIFSTPSNGFRKCTSSGSSCSIITAVPPGVGLINSNASTSSVAVGTGSKTFTVPNCFLVFSGVAIQIYETSAPTNRMVGTYSSCSGTTLLVSVATSYGSGTHTDWTIDITNWSTTSNTIGAGSKTFTVQTCAGVSANVQIYQSSNTANQMQGTATCVGTTLTFTSVTTWGSGTITDWSIFNTDNDQTTNGLVAYDPSSATTGGHTQGIYVCSYGSGVWHSTDAGATWANTSAVSTGVTTQCSKIIVDKFGQVWEIDFNFGISSTTTNLNKYASGSWANISNGSNTNYGSIAVDPHSTSAGAAYVIGNYPTSPTYSLDGGATWNNMSTSGGYTNTAADVPWLGDPSGPGVQGPDEVQFDPGASASVPGLVISSTGVGVWKYTPPNTPGVFVMINTSLNAGIEQLVSNMVIVPPGHNPILGAQDRPYWAPNLTQFPSTYGPFNGAFAISAGTIAYSSSDPTFIIGSYLSNSAISSNSGATWTLLSSIGTLPSGNFPAIPAATDANHLAFIEDGAGFYCSSNGGVSWNLQTINGIVGDDGWGNVFNAYYIQRWNLDTDKVRPNTFIAYNSGTTAPGVYASDDNCATWHQLLSGHISGVDGFALKLKSVPGVSGNYYLDDAGDVNNGHLFECTTNWTTYVSTCNQLSNIALVADFAFGAIKSGQTYPSIVYVGKLSGTYGFWRSDDHAVTWSPLTYPPTLDIVGAVGADQNTYGKYFIGFGGSGFMQCNNC